MRVCIYTRCEHVNFISIYSATTEYSRPCAPAFFFISLDHNREGTVFPNHLSPNLIPLSQIEVAQCDLGSSMWWQSIDHLIIRILKDKLLVAQLSLDIDINSRCSRRRGVENLVTAAHCADALTSLLCRCEDEIAALLADLLLRAAFTGPERFSEH